MKNRPKTIIMLAAENDALSGGKVGGLADVIRDLPAALAGFGHKIFVITPAYGFLHKENRATLIENVTFPFRGSTSTSEIWEVAPKEPKENVTQILIEHPEIRGGRIYSADPPGEPFASDATKFALFCSAAGQYLRRFPDGSIVHLHDWHTGFLNLLKELHPDFRHLKRHKVVFTIHNLGYQGNRPVRGKKASVELWFPELLGDAGFPGEWIDPRFKEPQFTPLAAGIRFSEKVNTVSPTYAEEILKPSDSESGFFGGEGLEEFLSQKKEENSLFGILNGIEYPAVTAPPLSFGELCGLCAAEIDNGAIGDGFLKKVSDRLSRIKSAAPRVLLTSVTRVTEQKVRLLLEPGSGGAVPLEEILSYLEKTDGYYFLLGNGPRELEEEFEKAFAAKERLIFIKLYSNKIGNALYSNGSIFLMPSSFEPCGISQMIAMRHAQPCVVHATGGLKDTVADGVNGFRFSGSTNSSRADGLISATKKAVEICLNDRRRWEEIKSKASGARFSWRESAERYIELMY